MASTDDIIPAAALSVTPLTPRTNGVSDIIPSSALTGVATKSPSSSPAPDTSLDNPDIEGDLGAGKLLTSGDFWRGAARGALRTFTSATAGNLNAAERDVQNLSGKFGISKGTGTPEGIAGEAVGGFLAPLPGGPAAKAAAPVEAAAVHPLQGIADLEAQKLSQVDERLSQAGITLPTDRQLSPIVTASNNVVAKELNLPKDAPLTEGMIEAGIKKNALPAYAEARKVAPWEASSAYESDASGINLKLIDEDIRPPASGELSGPEAVRLSQNLRNRATAYYRAAEMNPAFRPVAAAHDQAAEMVENEFERHMEDVPGVSANWDAARTYVAKAKNVEAALDGGGNVRPTMLKSQMLKGKPLSGGIQDLAIAAAKYPDYFKSTPALPPQVGIVRRTAAKFAPTAGAAIGAGAGGMIGFPTAGAVVGAEGGQKLSTLLNPHPR